MTSSIKCLVFLSFILHVYSQCTANCTFTDKLLPTEIDFTCADVCLIYTSNFTLQGAWNIGISNVHIQSSTQLVPYITLIGQNLQIIGTNNNNISISYMKMQFSTQVEFNVEKLEILECERIESTEDITITANTCIFHVKQLTAQDIYFNIASTLDWQSTETVTVRNSNISAPLEGNTSIFLFTKIYQCSDVTRISGHTISWTSNQNGSPLAGDFFDLILYGNEIDIHHQLCDYNFSAFHCSLLDYTRVNSSSFSTFYFTVRDCSEVRAELGEFPALTYPALDLQDIFVLTISISSLILRDSPTPDNFVLRNVMQAEFIVDTAELSPEASIPGNLFHATDSTISVTIFDTPVPSEWIGHVMLRNSNLDYNVVLSDDSSSLLFNVDRVFSLDDESELIIFTNKELHIVNSGFILERDLTSLGKTTFHSQIKINLTVTPDPFVPPYFPFVDPQSTLIAPLITLGFPIYIIHLPGVTTTSSYSLTFLFQEMLVCDISMETELFCGDLSNFRASFEGTLSNVQAGSTCFENLGSTTYIFSNINLSLINNGDGEQAAVVFLSGTSTIDQTSIFTNVHVVVKNSATVVCNGRCEFFSGEIFGTIVSASRLSRARVAFIPSPPMQISLERANIVGTVFFGAGWSNSTSATFHNGSVGFSATTIHFNESVTFTSSSISAPGDLYLFSPSVTIFDSSLEANLFMNGEIFEIIMSFRLTTGIYSLTISDIDTFRLDGLLNVNEGNFIHADSNYFTLELLSLESRIVANGIVFDQPSYKMWVSTDLFELDEEINFIQLSSSTSELEIPANIELASTSNKSQSLLYYCTSDTTMTVTLKTSLYLFLPSPYFYCDSCPSMTLPDYPPCAGNPLSLLFQPSNTLVAISNGGSPNGNSCIGASLITLIDLFRDSSDYLQIPSTFSCSPSRSPSPSPSISPCPCPSPRSSPFSSSPSPTPTSPPVPSRPSPSTSSPSPSPPSPSSTSSESSTNTFMFSASPASPVLSFSASSTIFASRSPSRPNSPSISASQSSTTTFTSLPSVSATSSSSISPSVCPSPSPSPSITFQKSAILGPTFVKPATLTISPSMSPSPDFVVTSVNSQEPVQYESKIIAIDICTDPGNSTISYTTLNEAISITCNSLPIALFHIVVNDISIFSLSKPFPSLDAYTTVPGIISEVIDIALLSGSFPQSVVLCFEATRETNKDVCLGYLDESVFPPQWICEDTCLAEPENGYCGRTRHFTNFAILLAGAFGEEETCGQGYGYVTGDWFGDLMLVMSIAIALIIVCLFLACLLTTLKPCKKLLYGREGYRIVSLRVASSKSQATVD